MPYRKSSTLIKKHFSDRTNKRIAIVGLNPSSKNTDPNTPFAGTMSEKRLQSWIEYLGLKDYFLMNLSNRVESDSRLASVSDEELEQARQNLRSFRHIIALGSKVSQNLRKLNVPHWRLPHPSGRNRLLNDPKYVRMELDKCKQNLKERGYYRD